MGPDGSSARLVLRPPGEPAAPGTDGNGCTFIVSEPEPWANRRGALKRMPGRGLLVGVCDARQYQLL